MYFKQIEGGLQELVFGHSRDAIFSEGSLNTVGKGTTIIFQNTSAFHPVFKGPVFNTNVTKVVLQNLQISDFTSDMFAGMNRNGEVSIKDCNIRRPPPEEWKAASTLVQIEMLTLENVAIDPTNNALTFLSFYGAKRVTFSHLNWNFNRIFTGGDIKLLDVGTIYFHDCTFHHFKREALVANSQSVSFAR